MTFTFWRRRVQADSNSMIIKNVGLIAFMLSWLSVVVITCLTAHVSILEDEHLIKSNHDHRHGRNLVDVVISKQNHPIKESTPHKRPATTTRDKDQPARFLLGIFTIADERPRRNLIRSAFAMYNDTRLCMFGSTSRGDFMPPPPRRDCELLYTFVIGANPNGKTQLVLDTFSGHDTSNDPLLTTPPPGFDATLEPNDITYLNIQENMNYGKTPTWFHYASRVMRLYDLDYVVKCDTDTYVMVDTFFDISKVMFPRGRGQTYGGFAVWSYPKRHIYMEGQFYLLSLDLAERVASASLNHTVDILFVEDADTGLVLMKHRRQLTHLVSMEQQRSWRHPLKKASTFSKFMIEESVRIGRPLLGTTSAPRVQV